MPEGYNEHYWVKSVCLCIACIFRNCPLVLLSAGKRQWYSWQTVSTLFGDHDRNAVKPLYNTINISAGRGMSLIPDTWNCGLLMRPEYRECFPCHRLQRKPLVSDLGMHHGTCFTHVPWCMSGSLTKVAEKKPFPAFPAHPQSRILRIWQEAHGMSFVSSLSDLNPACRIFHPMDDLMLS